MYIIAAGLYVMSAICYYMTYNGSPKAPLASDIGEMHANTLGSIGFLVTALLYMWGDDPTINYGTIWAEMFLYMAWLYEEASNARSWYR